MPNTLTAKEAAGKIREGLLTSRQLVEACLKRIEETDDVVHAWAHVDAQAALAQADQCDDLRRRGMPLGPLHGIPVGLKDIIDVEGMPCERGSPIFSGRIAPGDAFLVSRLREAGAVILGKTVTTELAFMNPSKTRNPLNPDHTPGGSSSGSAAAVAAFQVPLTIGTQTNGSVIRPAAYCGIFSFKPTRGIISRTGVLETSGSLDQLGVFARDLEDAAMLADALAAYDPADKACYPRARPGMLSGAREDAPVEPSLAAFALPYDDRISEDARAGMEELMDVLGGQVEQVATPPAFAALVDVQRTIHLFEYNALLGETCRSQWDKVSSVLKPLVEEAQAITPAAYEDALSVKQAAEDFFRSFFNDYDAVLTLSAAGEAPRFDAGTGDPVFCTIWTLAGLPCVSLPLLRGSAGLPIGIQLVGSAERDDRLMRTAGWLLKTLKQDMMSA